MSSLCTEVDWKSLNKSGEELCGDNVEVVMPDENTTVAVLADGLGSGVKASILSTLTAKIISTMMAQNMPLPECVSAIAATLPVCGERGIAYSTFTIIRVAENSRAEVIQFDNPRVILLRDGRHHEFDTIAQTVEGKLIHRSSLILREGDAFVAISDGVEHAGSGPALNFGWKRADIIRFLEGLYRDELSAHALTGALLDQCNLLYEGRPGDDTTVCTLKVRRRVPVNLLIGPPGEQEDTERVMALFFEQPGSHIVCGGTTAALAAKHLRKPVVPAPPGPSDEPGIPPMSAIEGVDLVTEGMVTLNRVLEHSQAYLEGRCDYYDLHRRGDGASRMAAMLFDEATDVALFVGRAVNPAHQSPGLPINFSLKMRMVQELAENLKSMGKRVRTSYF